MDDTLRTTQWLFRQVKPFWRLHLFALACLFLASILFIFNPLLMKFLIDDVIVGRRVGVLPVVILGLLVVFIFNQILVAFAGFCSFRVSRQVSFRMRLRALRDLQTLRTEVHEHASVGDRLYRLEHDVEQIGSLLGEAIPDAFRLLLVLLFIQLAMFILNLQLALVVLPLIPVFLLLVKLYRARLRSASDRVHGQQGVVSGFLQEHLSALVQVHLLSAEPRQARRFASLASGAERLQVARKVAELSFALLMGFVVMFGLVAVLAVGSHQAMSGQLTTGGLVAFYTYTLQVFGPLCGAVDFYSQLQRVGVSVRRVLTLSDTSQTFVDGVRSLQLSVAEAHIEMAEVCFQYSNCRSLLSGFSLTVAAGERVALVGANGCGKSTVLKLIARLYDVRSGAVRVGGVDVREIRLKSLRHNIGYVPQEPVLFDVSLRDNLLFGNPRANQHDLDKVAEVTLLETVLKKLPGDWQGSVGRLGCKLSGGERQRVALARVLLQRPRILLLDECTSALDEAAEEHILGALDEFVDRVTIIIVSHRAYARSWADRVVSMQSGRIVAEDVSQPKHGYYCHAALPQKSEIPPTAVL
jgi:ABC-type bacteriocin/lantibiotic exporter with double-glycine peptidase domain